MIGYFRFLRILQNPQVIKVGRLLRIRALVDSVLRIFPYSYTLSSGVKVPITSLEGWFLAQELFSVEMYSWLKPHAGEISHFLDVGSNRGYFPVYLAHIRRLQGLPENELCGIGVEANPQLTELSKRITRAVSFRSFDVIWGMVGGGDSSHGSFYLHASDGLSSRYVEGTEIKVPCVKIGEEWGKRFSDRPPDVIKIDIEGSEWDLLQTEGAFIGGSRWVIIECHAPMAPFDQVTKFMNGFGFQLKDVITGVEGIHCAVYGREE